MPPLQGRSRSGLKRRLTWLSQTGLSGTGVCVHREKGKESSVGSGFLVLLQGWE